jgi:chromosome condensin MukBEF ATPase and DNA-binding subunit MukB
MAGMLGALALAGAPQAFAKPFEPQENSFQSTVDGFVSYLKSETSEVAAAAARAARENRGTLAQAKASIGAQFSALREALSGQKARLATLGKDAATMGEEWKQVTISSWATMQRSAADALDGIATWMRNQSLSNKHPEIRV